MHVVVVGGGVVGLAQAWALARRGVAVTVLDARTPGRGASAANAGWLVPAMASPVPAPGVVGQALRLMRSRSGPLSVRPSLAPGFLGALLGMWRASTPARFRAGFAAQLALAAQADALVEDWLADGVAMELHRDGALLAFTDRARLAHELDHADLPAALGRPLEALDAAAAREREPTLAADVVGAVAIPTEWHVDPVALTAGLAARVTALGGRIVADAPVIGAASAHGADGRTVRAVVTEAGDEVPADAVVLAAGAWTGRLARELGAPLAVFAGSGHAVDLAPAGLPMPHGMLYLAEEKVAVTPLATRLRLAGTMRFAWPGRRPRGAPDASAVGAASTDAAVDATRHADRAPDPVERVDPVRARAIARSPRRYLAGWPDGATVDAATLGVTAGARPMTSDGLPLLGRLQGTTNVWVSSGHGMMGVTLAAASADALTGAVLGGEAPAVLAPFDPARFA